MLPIYEVCCVHLFRAPYRTRTGKPSPWQGDILPIELMAHKHVLFIVPQEGLEPSTHGLRVRCATNCATGANNIVFPERHGILV